MNGVRAQQPMGDGEGSAVRNGVGRSRERRVRLLILLLFFLSGACALIYEVVWMRMLTLVFGATAFATSTILAAFFGGLALGGFYFGRVADKGRRPLLLYALLEAGIGVCAFAMPVILSGLSHVYVGLSRQLAIGFYGISVTRFVLSFFVLLVPATLMGGTLPVIVKFFATNPERLGWDVGRLYSINTLGAVTGTIAAGFFLILLLGVNETAYVAGVLNLLIAGIAVVVDRRQRTRWLAGSGLNAPPRAPAEADERTSSATAVRLALWAIGVSGFCALALEVLWTRALVFFLDNSTHAFTTILTAFLLGIGIGSLLVARFIDKRVRLVASLGAIEILIGLFAILAIPLVSNATPVFQRMAGVGIDGLLPWKWMGARFATSLAVMLVPTILMGMAFPLAAKICARRLHSAGSALGDVYAVNTIGGVLGSAVAGFLLIPLIGVHAGIVVIAAANLGVGGLLVLSSSGIEPRFRVGAVVGSALLFAGTATVLFGKGAVVLTSHYEGLERPHVLSYSEGVGATVKVYRDSIGNKTLSVNGFPVAGTALTMQDIQKALAHLPMLLSNAELPRANIVGFGAGGTSWGMLQYDVASVDCVELVPGVVDAASWFPEINHGVLSAPRFSLILGDGRNYALVSEGEYDIISVDATSPKMAGNGSLYALEFYELIDTRLSDQGIAVQWIPFHLMSDREVRMIVKTFMTVFPHTTLWFTPLRQYFILVGTRERLQIDLAAMERKLERITVRRDLQLLNVNEAIDVLNLFVMGEEKLGAYAAGARMNTDNHPYLEFTPALAYFLSDLYWIRSMRSASEMRESVLPWLINVGRTDAERRAVEEEIVRRFSATQRSIKGDMLLFRGLRDEATAEYEAALEIDPGEKNWLNSVWLYDR